MKKIILLSLILAVSLSILVAPQTFAQKGGMNVQPPRFAIPLDYNGDGEIDVYYRVHEWQTRHGSGIQVMYFNQNHRMLGVEIWREGWGIVVDTFKPWTYPFAFGVSCDASPNPVGAGDLVNLTCESAGGTAPYTYTWDFNDDGVVDSTTQNPTYAYSIAGEYTACVTVTDSLGNEAECCVAITVIAPPD